MAVLSGAEQSNKWHFTDATTKLNVSFLCRRKTFRILVPGRTNIWKSISNVSNIVSFYDYSVILRRL